MDRPIKELIQEKLPATIHARRHDLHEAHLLRSTGRIERVTGSQRPWPLGHLLAHIGTWLAEAGVILERISVGTYRPEEIDVDTMNRQFLDAMKDVPLQTVRAQASASRIRMLRAWRTLSEPSPDAAFWIRTSGFEHYDEHLPRLREWVAELRSR